MIQFLPQCIYNPFVEIYTSNKNITIQHDTCYNRYELWVVTVQSRRTLPRMLKQGRVLRSDTLNLKLHLTNLKTARNKLWMIFHTELNGILFRNDS